MLNLLEADWRALWDGAHETEPQGAVYTRPDIVRLILDLADYTIGSQRLAVKRVLEPSCGDGAFIVEVVSRLIESEQQQPEADWDDPVLESALRAADISERALRSARHKIVRLLTSAGCPTQRATQLAGIWTVHTDFLINDWQEKFDIVVGNPPYVRIEDLPRRVLRHYRDAYESMTDRADLYIPFIERGLSCLSPEGALAYICANRWVKNQYGRVLRKQVAERYHVRYYLNLEHTQPFLSDVSAYPAIFVLDRNRCAETKAATLDDVQPQTLRRVVSDAKSNRDPEILSVFPRWYPEGGAWIATRSHEHRRLEQLQPFPVLEDSAPGTRVGIGVATGADRVFVLGGKHPNIEEDRQIPLALASNIGNQRIEWSGRYLVNPFADEGDGSLVDLNRYPGLKDYLERYGDALKKRHVARKAGARWYRTIDRVWPQLQHRPKLLIPDIQGETTVGFDIGEYYPHHNLYFITSDSWDLRALKALLRSTIVREQVQAYSVQMRGGSLRFQAQTLRKVRIPRLKDLSTDRVERLASISDARDQAEIDAVVEDAYFGAGDGGD